MRITQGMILRRSIRGFQDKMSNIDELQRMIATGKEIYKPSDGPMRFRRAARFENMFKRNEQFLDTVQRASARADATGIAIDQVNELLIRSREIAQQAADEHVDTGFRASMRDRMDGIIDEAISILNRKHKDQALFAGSMTDLNAPFTLDSGSVTYHGDDERLQRRITEELEMTINITGQQVFDTNLFTDLINLRNALDVEDRAVISASIDTLTTTSDRLLSLGSLNGSLQNTIDGSGERLERMNIELRSLISIEEETDMVEAIVKFESEQNAFTAALQSTTKIIRLNVMQFLR